MREFSAFTQQELEEIRRLLQHAQKRGLPGSKVEFNAVLVREHFERNAVSYIGRLLATVDVIVQHTWPDTAVAHRPTELFPGPEYVRDGQIPNP